MNEYRELHSRLKAFAVEVIQLYEQLHRSPVGQTLGRQLLRSGTSPGAQYREARRAKSTLDFISKVEGALQELDETGYWLELLVSASVVPQTRVAPLLAEVEELTAILVTVVKSAKQRLG